jgi:hypothetical protein
MLSLLHTVPCQWQDLYCEGTQEIGSIYIRYMNTKRVYHTYKVGRKEGKEEEIENRKKKRGNIRTSFRRVRVTIVAMEKQSLLNILSFCL